MKIPKLSKKILDFFKEDESFCPIEFYIRIGTFECLIYKPEFRQVYNTPIKFSE